MPAWVPVLPQLVGTWDGSSTVLLYFFIDDGIFPFVWHLVNPSLKMCLSLFLSLSKFMVNVTWVAKTCPSLRRAIRCTPGWWWSCWTRTRNGKRWASFMQNAGREDSVGNGGVHTTAFHKALLVVLLQTPSHSQGFCLEQGRLSIVRCKLECFPRMNCDSCVLIFLLVLKFQ